MNKLLLNGENSIQISLIMRSLYHTLKDIADDDDGLKAEKLHKYFRVVCWILGSVLRSNDITWRRNKFVYRNSSTFL